MKQLLAMYKMIIVKKEKNHILSSIAPCRVVVANFATVDTSYLYPFHHQILSTGLSLEQSFLPFYTPHKNHVLRTD